MAYATVFEHELWEMGLIPYVIDTNYFPVHSPAWDEINTAICTWNTTVIGVHLIPYDDQLHRDYISFTHPNDSSCS